MLEGMVHRRFGIAVAVIALLMLGGAPGLAQGHDQYAEGAGIVNLPLFSGPGVRTFSTYTQHDAPPGCGPDHLVKLMTSFSSITTTKAYLTSITAYYSMQGTGILSGGVLQVSTGKSGEEFHYTADISANYYYNPNGWSGHYTTTVGHYFTYAAGQLHIYVEKHTDTSNYLIQDCHHVTAFIYLRNS
jgi:hypothetical protein